MSVAIEILDVANTHNAYHWADTVRVQTASDVLEETDRHAADDAYECARETRQWRSKVQELAWKVGEIEGKLTN